MQNSELKVDSVHTHYKEMDEMKKILSVLSAVVFFISAFTFTASAKVEADVVFESDAKFTNMLSNGVTKTVDFESFFSAQIIFYPSDIKESNEKYPVISWANGTMCPPILYYGLLSRIAAEGYIVVANTQVMSADGTGQIASIDYIFSENDNENSILYNKVDKENIGVIGHSQGGRSAVNAAVADERIDCVLSIAGSNYKEEAEKLSTPTFFVAGEMDFIVFAPQWINTAYNACTGTAVYATLKKAIHTSCIFKPELYSDYATEWFDGWLKNDDEAMNLFENGGALSTDSMWKDFMCKGF